MADSSLRFTVLFSGNDVNSYRPMAKILIIINPANSN